MSLSNDRSRIDRLTKDLAGLERKRSDALGKAAKERKEATRIRGSISRTTSESSRNRKLGDAAKREEQAAGHDTSAAKLADQAAGKQRDLSAAQTRLEKELEKERKTDERAARRRREEDLKHLTELERRQRRTVYPLPVAARAVRPPAPAGNAGPQADGQFEYDVCLSFAGEDRAYVHLVARALKERGVRAFFDEDEQTALWGKDLAEHLDWVYRHASRYCVMFISEAYANKPWTRHERRSALARALNEEGEYVLPARFDATELPGLPPTVAYVDLAEFAPASLAQAIADKLEGGNARRSAA